MKTYAFVLALAALFISSCSSNKISEPSSEEKKADVYYGQGTNELVSKNYVQALLYLTKAKELNPKDSKIRTNLGMAYYFRDQPALAEEELKKAISLDDKNSDARLNLGSLYMEKNRDKEARALFEKVLKDLTFSNQFRNYYNLAILALKEGDRREAFNYLNKSVAEREDYCAGNYKLGELYAEEFRYKQALDSFKNASKGTCVSEPAPHYQQAITLLNLNRNSEAKAKFLEIQEKFSATQYASMAGIQIKKINNSNEQSARSTQTEKIDSNQSVETPNF
jgi:type IV pilus assembly protein PilF